MGVKLDAAFTVSFDGMTSYAVQDRFIRENEAHPDREISQVNIGEYVIRQGGATVEDVVSVAETIFSSNVEHNNAALIRFCPGIEISETETAHNIAQMYVTETETFYVFGETLEKYVEE